MLKIQEVSSFITNELNTLANGTGYSFNIYAEVGESKNDGSINGVLRTANVTTTPIEDYVENNYTFVVEMPIARSRANKNLLDVEQIIEEFVDTYDGTNQAFSEGYGILNISPSKPKDFKVADNVGDCVPLFFTMQMLYTESAITSSNKKWFLDGLAIPFLNENVLVDKEGAVRKINGKKYTETFLTGQTKFYKFQFPFQNITLCNTLQGDLLEGNFDKTYTLTYYDGVNYTSESPFSTTVSIFKTGDSGSQVLKVSMFNITFTDVDSGTNTTKYSMALVDNPFDANTDNTRWFDTEQDQIDYFEGTGGLISTGAQYEQIKAPNLNSIDITSQVYPNTRGYDVFDLTNKNYAIIKVEKGVPTDLTYSVKRFYYYVSNAQIGANNQVMFDLSLDTVQTYFIPNKDGDLNIGDSYIERACLNRFVDNNNGTVSFDGTVNSKLFENEPVQGAPKRMTKRTKIGACNTGDATFDAWINEHVEGWIVAFINPNYSFTGFNEFAQSGNKQLKIYDGLRHLNGENLSLMSCIPTIIFPVLKKGNNSNYCGLRVYNGTGTDKYGYLGISSGYTFGPLPNTTVNVDTLNAFNYLFQGNNADNSFYSIKFTSTYPFIDKPNYTIDTQTCTDGTTTYTVQWMTWSFPDTNMGRLGDGIHVDNASLAGTALYNQKISSMFLATSMDVGGNIPLVLVSYPDAQQRIGFLYIREQKALNNLQPYTVNKTLTFNKNIFNSTLAKSSIYNPKLLGQNFFELKVSDETENGFDYDLQKLNTNNLQLGITEPLVPDNTKKYIRALNTTGVYIGDNSKNFVGFVGTNETTFTLTTSAYLTMLANNKNFFTQNAVNRGLDLTMGLLSGGFTTAKGIAGAMAGNPYSVRDITAGASEMLGTVKNVVLDKVKEGFTVDNLKNTPDNLKQALGNIYFSNQCSAIGTYVEEYDILPAEKEVVNDYMVQYGFTTNQIGQIGDYLNIRKYFNYIKAQINSISGVPMSNTARNDLRRRFAEGIRFWNSDTVDYSKENYEKWLEPAPTPPTPSESGTA